MISDAASTDYPAVRRAEAASRPGGGILRGGFSSRTRLLQLNRARSSVGSYSLVRSRISVLVRVRKLRGDQVHDGRVGERRGVADGAVLRDVLQQAAHELPGPRPRPF